jgi:hypothetical protein
MTAIAIETDLRASLDELARACRILEPRGKPSQMRKKYPFHRRFLHFAWPPPHVT